MLFLATATVFSFTEQTSSETLSVHFPQLSERTLEITSQASNYTIENLTRNPIVFGKPVSWELLLSDGVQLFNVEYTTPPVVVASTQTNTATTWQKELTFSTNFTEGYANISYEDVLPHLTNFTITPPISYAIGYNNAISFTLPQLVLEETILLQASFLDTNNSIFNTTNTSPLININTSHTNQTVVVNHTFPTPQETLKTQQAKSKHGNFALTLAKGQIKKIAMADDFFLTVELENITQPENTTIDIELPKPVHKNIHLYLWYETPTGDFKSIPYIFSKNRKTLTLHLADLALAPRAGAMKFRLKVGLSDYAVSVNKKSAQEVDAVIDSKLVVFETAFADVQSFSIVDPENLPEVPQQAGEFTHKLLKFTLENLTQPNVTINLTFDDLPEDFQLWKFNANTGNWYTFPYTQLDANTLQITLVDGGLGDDDGIVNGIIVDDLGITLGWQNDSFDWRIAFNVTATSGSLVNYSTLVLLNNTVFNFSNAQDDLADLRIAYYNATADTETLVAHWVENYDQNFSSGSTAARVWFKALYLANNTNTTFFVYYGNPSASSTANGSDVFLYFDDFENGIGFDTGELSLVQNTSSAKTGTYGISGDGTETYDQAFNSGVNSGQDIVVESWVKSWDCDKSQDTSLAGVMVGHPTVGVDQDGYQAYLDERGSPYLGIRQDYDNGDVIASATSPITTFDTWYFHSFTWTTANELIFKLYDEDRSLLQTISATDATYTDGEFGIGAWGCANWDEFRMRPYTATEPTITFYSGSDFVGIANISIDRPVNESNQTRIQSFTMNGTLVCSRGQSCGNVSTYFQYYTTAAPTQSWFETSYTDFNDSDFENTYNISSSQNGFISLDVVNSGHEWWNVDWSNRMPLKISNVTANATAIPVKLIINSSMVGTSFDWTTDYNSSRFIWMNETSGLAQSADYWIEEWNTGAQNATIWVEIPYLEENTNTSLYLYYGNDAVTTLSDVDSVFLFYDDFSDGNDDGWTVRSGTWVVENNESYYQTTTLTTYLISEAGDSSWEDYTVETSINMTGFGGSTFFAGLLYRYQDTNNHYAVILDDRADDSIWLRQWIEGSYATEDQEWNDVNVDLNVFLPLRVDIFTNDAGTHTNRIHFDNTIKEYNYSAFGAGNIGLIAHNTQPRYDFVSVRKFTPSQLVVTNYSSEELNVSSNGEYYSNIYDFETEDVTFEKIYWTSSVPGQTSFSMHTRSSVGLAGAWYSADWPYQKEINISNTAGPLYEYQVFVQANLSTEYAAGKIQNNCSDVRFIYLNQTSLEQQEVNFFTDACDLTNEDIADFWVKVPFLKNGTITKLYLYYGNNSLPSASNIANTFTYTTNRTVGYVVSNMSARNGIRVTSLEDNNEIAVGSVGHQLNEFDNELVVGGSLTIGSAIKAKNLIQAEGNGDADDMIVPLSWAATHFVYEGMRSDNDTYCFVSPWGTAEVNLSETGVLQWTDNVTAAGVCYQADFASNTATTVDSSIPILAYHHGRDISQPPRDSWPFYPASTGPLYHPSRSNAIYIGVGENITTLTCYGSDGTSQTRSNVAAFGYTDCTSLSNGNSGSGAAAKIVSDYPIGAVQQADHDGTESTVFVPRKEMGTVFGAYHDAEYIALVSPYSGFDCDLYDSSGFDSTATFSTSSTEGVAKACFGCGSDATYITGPWKVVCEQPVWIYYEEDSDGDETNLFGYKQMRQYVYPAPTVAVELDELNYTYVSGNPDDFYQWSPWFLETDNTSISSPDNRYLQYRVTLSTTNSTKSPILDDVTLEYKIIANAWKNMKPSGTSFTANSPYSSLLNQTVNVTPSLAVTPQEVGTYLVRLLANSSSLSETFISENRSITINLQPAFSSFTTSSNLVARDGEITLSALFLDDVASPIKYYNVSFYDETGNGSRYFIGWAITDETGYATTTYTIPSDATYGTHILNVSYNGSTTNYINKAERTRTIKVSSSPVVHDVFTTPANFGYGFNISIQANITDGVGLDTVLVNITNESGQTETHEMTLLDGFYVYNFSQPWLKQNYNYTIIANNTDSVTTIATGNTFGLVVQSYVDIKTEKDAYRNNELVELSLTKGQWPEMEGWLYRLPVNITSEASLTDYQVQINLDSSNFRFSESNNGSDIRFTYYNTTTGNETNISHWTESYNATAQSATIWVNVPEISDTVQTKINLYYGNDNVNSSSNGTNTFIYFEDFDTTPFDWYNSPAGSGVVLDSTRAYSGTYSGHKIGGNDYRGAIEDVGTTFGRDVIMEFWVNRNAAFGGGQVDRIGFIEGTGDGYGWAFDHNADDILTDVRTNYGPATLNPTSTPDVMDEWVFGQFVVKASGVVEAYRYVDGTLLGSMATTSSTHNAFNRVYIFGGYDYWVDDIRIRKTSDTAFLTTSFGTEEVDALGLINEENTKFKGDLKMIVQRWTGSAWQNLNPPVIEDDEQILDTYEVVDLASIWDAAGAWNTTTRAPGTYRIYAIMEDSSNNLLENIDGTYIVGSANFTIKESEVRLVNLTYENEFEQGLLAYETGDVIDWINATVQAFENIAYDANATLSLLDSSKSSVGWGPQSETKLCGDLLENQTCEQQWNNASNGYIIPTDAASGTYTFYWDVLSTSENGQEYSNNSISFAVHNIPQTANTSLSQTRVYKPNSTIFNVTFTNLWNENLSGVSANINCPAFSGFTCQNLTPTTFSSIENETDFTIQFNVSANESVPSNDYNLTVELNYTNPGGETKSWNATANTLLEVRLAGILVITDYLHPITVTRNNNANFYAYMNNSGDTIATNAWLNYTFPTGWTVTTGNQDESFASIPINGVVWNNITAQPGINALLGSRTIRLDSNADDGRNDFKQYTVTVYANTSLSLTKNLSIVNRGEHIGLTGTLTYDNGTPVTNRWIYFYDETENTYLGANQTNALGQATLAYYINSSSTLSLHTLNASFNGTTSLYLRPTATTTSIDVHEKPQFSNVLISPNLSGYGSNVYINSTVTDIDVFDEIDTVWAIITYPDASTQRVNLTNVPPDDFYYIFNETWELGNYAVTLYANDTTGAQNNSNSYSFSVNASLLLSMQTAQNSYSQNEEVNLSDGGLTSWWNTDWPYRIAITAENTAENLTDYQLFIRRNLGTAYTNGNIQADCSDVRFTYYNTTAQTEQEITFYTDYCSLTSINNADFWAKIPFMQNATNTTVYLYYGNNQATDASNLTATFTYDSPKTIGYVVGEDHVSNGLEIMSYVASNEVNVGASTYTLGEFGTQTVSSGLSLATEIQAKDAVQIEGAGADDDIIAPVSWASTEFIFGGMRSNDRFCMLSPWGSASVTIYDGGSSDWSGTVTSSGTCQTVDISNGNAARVVSDIPILVVKTSTNSRDAYTFYPATTDDIYGGSASNAVFIASGPSVTAVSCIGADATSGSTSIPANDEYDCGADVTTGDSGSGTAVKVVSDYKIGAIQQADHDGTESTVLVPTKEFGTVFGSGLDAQYIAVVSLTQNNNCSIYTSGGLFDWDISTGTSALSQACFGCNSDSVFVSGPWKMECEQPVWAYYEDDNDHETNMLSYKQLRQYVHPEPSLTYSSEQSRGSKVYNQQTNTHKGYVLLTVQENSTGSWNHVATISNDTSTLRSIPATGLDLATIWNSVSWNTGTIAAGTYRAYGALQDDQGTTLTNYDSSEITGDWEFILEAPDLHLAIDDLRIYDVTETAQANWRIYTGDLIGSGLNNSHTLYKDDIYRIEVDVENIGSTTWTINDTTINYSNFNQNWTINETDYIWYSTLATIANRRADTSKLSGNFTDTITWDISSNQGTVAAGDVATFFFIINMSEEDTKGIRFRIEHPDFDISDYSTLESIIFTVNAPALYNDIYNFTDTKVIRGDNTTLYARWDKTIGEANFTYNVVTPVGYATYQNTTPANTKNWSNYTINTGSTWFLGNHSAKIIVEDQSGNTNTSLPYLTFGVWGHAQPTSIQLNTSNIAVGDNVSIQCRITDATNGNSVIAGYNVSFTNGTDTLGWNTTSATGWAVFNYHDLTAGSEQVGCFITESAADFYTIGALNSTMTTLLTTEEVLPTYSSLSGPTTAHKGDVVGLNSYWQDNFGLDFANLSTNATGTFANASRLEISGLADWANFSYTIPTSMTPGTLGWKVHGVDTSGNVNTTYVSTIAVWGYSEIGSSTLSPASVQEGNPTTMGCRIVDEQSLSALSNYNVTFYYQNKSNPGYIYLGYNLTNTTGWANYNFILPNASTYDIKCNITDDATQQYNSSTPFFAVKELNVVSSADVYPPLIINGNYGINDTELYRGQCFMVYGEWNESINESWIQYNNTPTNITEFNGTAPFTANWTNISICTNNTWVPGEYTVQLFAKDQEGNLNNTLSTLSFEVKARANLSWIGPIGDLNRTTINLSCQVHDFDTGDPISGYTVRFYDGDEGSTLGNVATNASGVATLEYDYTIINSGNPVNVGPDALSCQIFVSAGYELATSFVEETVYFYGDLAANITTPVSGAIMHTGVAESLVVNAEDEFGNTVRDINGNVATIDATWKNSTQTTLATGASTTWSIPATYATGVETITVNITEPYYRWNTDSVNVNIWGYADVTISTPPAGTYANNTPLMLTCRVTNSATGQGINTYPIAFYNDSTLLTTTPANATGYATYTINTNTMQEGDRVLRCEIDNNAPLLYNKSSAYQSNVSVIVDASAPVIMYTASSDANNTYNRNWIYARVLLTEPNLDTLYLNWNGTNETFTASAGNEYWTNKTGLGDGNYTYLAWANDTAGNTGQSLLRKVIVDTTSPVVTIYSPQEQPYNATTLLINYTVTDANVDACWYNLDNNATTNSTLTGCQLDNLTSLSEGNHSIIIYANDTAGNLGQTAINFSVDTTFPTVSISHPVNTSSYFDDNVQDLNFSTGDDIALDSCWYTLDNGAEAPIPGCANTSISGLTNENHTLSVFVNDTAGNVNNETIWFIINLNKLIPLPVAPENNSYLNNQTIYVNATTNINATSCNYSIDDGVPSSMTNSTNLDWYALTPALTETFHNLTFYCWNGSANIQTEYRYFTIDVTAPVVSYELPTDTDGLGVGRNWTLINISTNEPTNVGILEWYNGATYQNYTMNKASNTSYWINMSGLADDTYSYRVFANDSADNFGNTTSRTIIVATTIPYIMLTSPVNTTEYTSNLLWLNATASKPISTWTFELNEENYTFTPDIIFPAELFENNLTVYATDADNNTGKITIAFTVNNTVTWTDTFQTYAGLTAAENLAVDTNASVDFCWPVLRNETFSAQNNMEACWHYRQPVSVTSTTTLIDYQTVLHLNISSLVSSSKANADCSDLRFTYYNETTNQDELIDYFLDDCSNTDDVQVWLKLPLINSSSKVHVYYGNPRAEDKSNGTAIFELFEPFNSVTVGNWGSNAANWASSNGISYPTTSGGSSQITSTTATSTQYAIELKLAGNSTSGSAGRFFFGRPAGANKYMGLYIDPPGNRVRLFNNAYTDYTINASEQNKYSLVADFVNNNYTLHVNNSVSPQIELSTSATGSIPNPIFYSYYTQGLLLDYYALRKYSPNHPTVGSMGGEETPITNATFRSKLISPNPFGAWVNFIASGNFPAGTDVTFQLRNATDANICGNLTYAQVSAGYEPCMNAAFFTDVYLWAQLETTATLSTPYLFNWTIEWNTSMTDNIVPQVTVTSPLAITQNQSTSVLLQATVIDNVNMSHVFANVSWDAGVNWENIELIKQGTSNTYNATFTNTSLIGVYNVAFFANDSRNNINDTETGNFTIRDSVGPTINSHNASPSPTAYELNITILANVTDNLGVGDVFVEIENTNYTMQPLGGQVYSYEFNTTDYAAGTYNYYINANDTSNPTNWAIEQTGSFTIAQATSNISLFINGTQGNYETNQDYQINLSAIITKPSPTTDYIAIFVNGTLSANASGTAENITSFTPGTYNISASYLGNENYTSASVWYTLTVNDTEAPIINNYNATPNLTAYRNEITIFANITDNILVDTVLVEIVGVNYSMNGPPGDIYNYTFNTTDYAAGFYNYTIWVNDTANNSATKQTGNFTIIQVTSILALYLNGTQGNENATTADIINITSVLTLPAGTSDFVQIYREGLLIANSSSPAVNISQQPLGYHNITAEFLGNVNFTGTSVMWFLNITDGTPPSINSHNATPNSTIYGNNITLYANVTDNVAVDTVYFEINGVNQSTTPAGDIYSYEFNTTDYAVGFYTYRVLANDSSDNFATPQIGNFTIFPATSELHLYLNGTEDNVSFDEDLLINLTADLSVPVLGENVWILLDGVSVANSSSPAVNISAHQPGVYNITAVYAGNENYSGTRVTWFMTINDTTNPNVTALLPTTGFVINDSMPILISANITDNVNVSKVFANVSWNGMYNYIELTSTNNLTYNYTFTNTSWVGNYGVLFFANDSVNNINNTETTWFNVTFSDDQAPNITSFNATPNVTSYGNNITIYANVTDNVDVSDVFVEFDGTNYSMTNDSLPGVGGSIYGYRFNTSNYAVNIYSFRIVANDTNKTHLLTANFTQLTTGDALTGLLSYCELRENSTNNWSSPIKMSYDSETTTYSATLPSPKQYWFQITCVDTKQETNLFIIGDVDTSKPKLIDLPTNELFIEDLYEPVNDTNSPTTITYQTSNGNFVLTTTEGILEEFGVTDTLALFFTIRNVSSKPVAVDLALPFALPKGLHFYLWKEVNGETIAVPYEISSDSRSLTLILQDGVIDEDGLVNGVIVDPLQLMLPTYDFFVSKTNTTSTHVTVAEREFFVTTPKGALESVALVDPLNLPNLPGTPNSFTHKLVRFTADTLGAEALDVYLTYDDLPIEFELWKFNSQTIAWYEFPYERIDEKTIMITLYDGGLGDDDGEVNGIIVDDVGIISLGTELRIGDLSDSQTVYSNEQNYFYANYTNASDGSAINDTIGYCEFTENSTGSWSALVNMTYNYENGLYELNRTITTGTHMFNVSCFSTDVRYQNITLNETFNITLFVDEAPVIEIQLPAANVVTTVQNVSFSCGFTDTLNLANITLYLTNATNESFGVNDTTIVSGLSNSSSWEYALDRGTYTWNCLAEDNASQATGGVNKTIYVNEPANATYTGFSGNTTAFNTYPTPEAILGATLDAPGDAQIEWNGVVNASNQDFDSFVTLGQNVVSVDIGGLDTSFNSSANVTLRNISWAYPVVYRNGVLCTGCDVLSYANDVLVFNVTGFSSYTTGEGTNLSIWDTSDSVEVFNDEQNIFYANYTNITDGSAITGLDVYCEFTENSTGTWSALNNMTYNITSGLYEYNKTLHDGISQFNVSCYNDQNYANLSLVDSVNITRRPTRELHILNITYSSSSPIEGTSVTVYVNVSNTGNESATNFTLDVNVSLWNGTAGVFDETLSLVNQNIADATTTLFELSWTAQPGTYIFDAYVDSEFNVTELNETNNTFSTNVTVDAWAYQHGEINHTVVLGAGTNEVLNWSDDSEDGYVFFYDYDSSINLLALEALGTGSNDFIEADEALGMTGFSDSIAELFDADGNDIADSTTSVTVFGTTYNDVPTTLSTNSSSSFTTGIMWDATGGGEYDGSQDLVIVAIVSATTAGAYGTYDYEVRVPALLKSWKGSNDFFAYATEFT
ncbi:DUF2341 domain-containing protein [Candidatus Woesearchaeota archaeon]|nr:DUF2341 domain-containing protein [Candidatus Woesearchaeota archaeon]